jgi:hypothetical protein
LWPLLDAPAVDDPPDDPAAAQRLALERRHVADCTKLGGFADWPLRHLGRWRWLQALRHRRHVKAAAIVPRIEAAGRAHRAAIDLMLLELVELVELVASRTRHQH